MLAGSSSVDLEAADLPPGVYEPSREHLGHALAGGPVAAGGETELVQIRATAFEPAFFSHDEYRTMVGLVALILGEQPDAAVVSEIAEWMDLTVAEAPEVRRAARALSSAHRIVGIHYYGAGPVKMLEEFDAQEVARQGLAWLDRESQSRHGRAFAALGKTQQNAIIRSIADDRPEPRSENDGTRFFHFLKQRALHGFYTSRRGLEELGYRGNAFYASPPGCEHLYA